MNDQTEHNRSETEDPAAADAAPSEPADPTPDGPPEGAAAPHGDVTSDAAIDDPAAEMARLADAIEKLAAENAQLKDQALRAMAEAENTRRRFQREKDDATRYGIAGFARDLLEIADNLQRAIDAAPEAELADHPLAKQLSVGVSMTEKMLADAFAKHGISRIDPAGEKFDPNFHQAMFEVPDPSRPPGTVVQVVQVGYVLHGRLLRPAMVGIAKGGEAPQRVDTEA